MLQNSAVSSVINIFYSVMLCNKYVVYQKIVTSSNKKSFLFKHTILYMHISLKINEKNRRNAFRRRGGHQ